MNSLNKANGRFKINKTSGLYFLYLIFLYILAIYIWPLIRSEEFELYHFNNLNFNGVKCAISAIFAFTMWWVIDVKYYKISCFSQQVILMLILLYFMPGMAIAGVMNFEWKYILKYYLYFLVLVIWDKILKLPKCEFWQFTAKSSKILQIGLIILSLIIPLYLVRVFSSSFSVAEIILTLNDPYGVRSVAKEMNVDWLILIAEYWAVYFSIFMITYCLRKKKICWAFVFIINVLFFFTLQGNRIYVFLLILAIIFGVFEPTKKFVAYSMCGILFVQIVEFTFLKELGPITNVFRRFSIVPNLVSTSWYDFFQTNAPDWLRNTFTGISALLGLDSPYGYEINTMIGMKYYGFNMYANTGLFGGAYYEFGEMGVLIDTVMYIIGLRLIEKVLFKAEQEMKFIVAVIYTSLSINTPVIWTGYLKFSYILLFLLSLYLFINGSELWRNRKEKRENKFNGTWY